MLRTLIVLILGTSFFISAAVADVELAPPQVVKAAGQQSRGAVATDGDGFLVVWVDSRSNGVVMGTRITARGEVLDPFGLIIGRHAESPCVAWNGSRYIVVWSDQEALYAAPVSRDGTAGEVVALGEGHEPQIASNGNGAVIVVRRTRGSPRVISLSPSLQMLSEFLIGEERMIRGPRLVADGDGYQVIWDAYSTFTGFEILGRRLDSSGRPLETYPVVLVKDATDGAIAPGPAGVLLVYQRLLDGRYPNTPVADGFHSVLISRGQVSNSTAVIQPVRKPGYSSILVRHGNGFTLLWQRENGYDPTPAAEGYPLFDVWVTRLDAGGAPVSEEPLQQTADESDYEVAAVSNGASLFVLWTTHHYPFALAFSREVKLKAAMVNESVSSAVPIDVAFSAPHQTQPKVVWTGDRYVSVWAEERGVYTSSGTSSGRLLEPGARLIAAGRALNPNVACSRTECLAVWQADGYVTAGRRFDHSGVFLDPEPFAISVRPGYSIAPAVASDGNGFAVLYGIEPTTSVAVALIDETGQITRQPIEPPRGISAGSRHSGISWDGENYIAVWAPSDLQYSVLSVRISATGTILDPVPVTLATNASWPAIACSGRTCLIVWAKSDLQTGAVLLVNGIKVSPYVDDVLQGADRNTRFPDVIATPTGFIASWHTTDTRLQARAVDLSGMTASADSLVSGLAGVRNFSLATNGLGQFVAAYQKTVDGDPYGGVDRIFLRLLPDSQRRRAVRR